MPSTALRETCETAEWSGASTMGVLVIVHSVGDQDEAGKRGCCQ